MSPDINAAASALREKLLWISSGQTCSGRELGKMEDKLWWSCQVRPLRRTRAGKELKLSCLPVLLPLPKLPSEWTSVQTAKCGGISINLPMLSSAPLRLVTESGLSVSDQGGPGCPETKSCGWLTTDLPPKNCLIYLVLPGRRQHHVSWCFHSRSQYELDIEQEPKTSFGKWRDLRCAVPTAFQEALE